MNVANPERAIKIHARGVTKLDLSVLEFNILLLSMSNAEFTRPRPNTDGV
jgi:hypothetical protein